MVSIYQIIFRNQQGSGAHKDGGLIMKPRPKGFLSCDKIDHMGEIFDYIRELHAYLNEFCGGGSGNLADYLDKSLAKHQSNMTELRAYRRIMSLMEHCEMEDLPCQTKPCQ